MSNARDGSDLLEAFSNALNAGRDVSVKEESEVCFFFDVLPCFHPAGDVWVPAQVSWVDVENPSSGVTF